MIGVFNNASSLTSIDLPNVKAIGTFKGASYLTSINLPNVEVIGYEAFKDASSLISVNTKKLETFPNDIFDIKSKNTENNGNGNWWNKNLY